MKECIHGDDPAVDPTDADEVRRRRNVAASRLLTADLGPISPELVLVCPELAERARAALPDPPWSRPVGQGTSPSPGDAKASEEETLYVRLEPYGILLEGRLTSGKPSWNLARPGGAVADASADVRTIALGPQSAPALATTTVMGITGTGRRLSDECDGLPRATRAPSSRGERTRRRLGMLLLASAAAAAGTLVSFIGTGSGATPDAAAAWASHSSRGIVCARTTKQATLCSSAPTTATVAPSIQNIPATSTSQPAGDGLASLFPAGRSAYAGTNLNAAGTGVVRRTTTARYTTAPTPTSTFFTTTTRKSQTTTTTTRSVYTGTAARTTTAPITVSGRTTTSPIPPTTAPTTTSAGTTSPTTPAPAAPTTTAVTTTATSSPGAGAPSGGVVGSANVWVSLLGSDSSCGRSASLVADPGGGRDCASFNGALAVAHAGDEVAVECGSYGSQTLTGGPAVAPAVVVAPTTPGCVTIGSAAPQDVSSWNAIVFETSFVTVQNLVVKGQLNIGGAAFTCRSAIATDHDSWLNNTAYAFSIQGGTNIDVEGNSFGPHVFQSSDPYDTQNYLYGCGSSWPGHPASGVFAHNTIHDTITSCSGCHINGIYLAGDDDQLTIADNKFLNLAQDDLAISPAPELGNVTNVTIENNVFGAVCAHDIALFPGDNSACGDNPVGAVQFQAICNGGAYAQNVVIRNNTLDGTFGIYPIVTTPGSPGYCSASDLANVTGNVFANNIIDTPSYILSPGSCNGLPFSLVAFSYDVWHDDGSNYAACGAGSVSSTSVNFTFASPEYPNYDWTIGAGSTACDYVPASQPHPATDINGASRPDDGEPLLDAGAYETCP